MKLTVVLFLGLFFAVTVNGETPDPIIDVHLHAATADAQGPPPVGICTPYKNFPVWDQKKPYGATFISVLKNPPCKNPVWSPKTDEEVKSQTIAVMQETQHLRRIDRNSRKGRGMEERRHPGRFYSGLGFQLGRDKYTRLRIFVNVVRPKASSKSLEKSPINMPGSLPTDPTDGSFLEASSRTGYSELVFI